MRWIGSVVGLLAMTLVTTASGGVDAQTLDDVAVQLKWHHQTQFAGIYAAGQKGFYRAEKLAVQSRAWKVGAASPVEQVVSGAVAFGITSQTEFLLARERGTPIVAIAAIYQKSPVGFFALKTSGIKHPRQFAGKSIAFAPTHEMHLTAMLRRFRLDVSALRRVPYTFDLAPFYRGDVDVWAGYVMNQPVDARLAGHEVAIIFPDDYGVHVYDDVVFTSEDLVRRNPALVERWLRATLRGWRYAIEHPGEATGMTLAVDPALTREKQMAMLLASIPLIHTGEHPLGWMTREIWESAHRLLQDSRRLARPVALDDAYTTRFLEKAQAR